MKCSECGVDGHGAFCSACGSKLVPEPEPAPVAASAATDAAQAQIDTDHGVAPAHGVLSNPRLAKLKGLPHWVHAAVLGCALLLVALIGINLNQDSQGPVASTAPTSIVPPAPDPIAVARAACYDDVGSGVSALVDDSNNVSSLVMKYGAQSDTFAMIRQIWAPVAQEQASYGRDAGLQMGITLVNKACDGANPYPVTSVPEVTTPAIAEVPNTAPSTPAPTEAVPTQTPAQSPSPAPLTMGVGPDKVGCNVGASACAFDNGIDFTDLYKQVARAYTLKTGYTRVQKVNCDSAQQPNHVPVGKQIVCVVTADESEGKALLTVTDSSPFWRLDSFRDVQITVGG